MFRWGRPPKHNALATETRSGLLHRKVICRVWRTLQLLTRGSCQASHEPRAGSCQAIRARGPEQPLRARTGIAADTVTAYRAIDSRDRSPGGKSQTSAGHSAPAAAGPPAPSQQERASEPDSRGCHFSTVFSESRVRHLTAGHRSTDSDGDVWSRAHSAHWL